VCDARTRHPYNGVTREVGQQRSGSTGVAGGCVRSAYKEAHPDEFFPRTLLVSQAVGKIEAGLRARDGRSFFSIRMRMGDIVPDAEKPDVPVFCYARGDAYRDVLENIRGELTRRLLAILPELLLRWTAALTSAFTPTDRTLTGLQCLKQCQRWPIVASVGELLRGVLCSEYVGGRRGAPA